MVPMSPAFTSPFGVPVKSGSFSPKYLNASSTSIVTGAGVIDKSAVFDTSVS